MSVILLLLLVAVVSCSAQCPACDCFPVNTTNTTLQELSSHGALFSQSGSASSRGAGIDTVCYTFTDICSPDSIVLEMALTYKNGSTLLRPSIQKFVEPGQFLIAGPARTHRDFIIGNPCPGTYVIYRCLQTSTCVTKLQYIDVFVVSKNYREKPACIEEGQATAQKAFPTVELGFYTHPRMAGRHRCTCQIAGRPITNRC